MTVNVVIQPIDEPVSLDEAKQHLRVTIADDDSYIEGLISAARAFAENFTGRALMTQTLEYTLDSLSGRVLLPRPKLQSIEYIRYSSTTEYDTDIIVPGSGSPPAIGDFLIRYGEPASIYPLYNGYWPTLIPYSDLVKIRYVAGYGDEPEDVPADIRHALLMLIGHWFENREAVVVGETPHQIPMAAEALLLQHRVYYV